MATRLKTDTLAGTPVSGDLFFFVDSSNDLLEIDYDDLVAAFGLAID